MRAAFPEFPAVDWIILSVINKKIEMPACALINRLNEV